MQYAGADQAADDGDANDRQRVLGREKERRVLDAMGGVDRRTESAGDQAGDSAAQSRQGRPTTPHELILVLRMRESRVWGLLSVKCKQIQ